MARLPYLTDDEMASLPIADHAKSINLYRILGHSPGLSKAFNGLGRYIRWDSKCDARLRELAILQVGYVARAAYEWSHHIKIGYDFGVTDDDIAALIAETEGKSSGLDALSKAVCRAAREMTRDYRVSDATYAELSAAMDREALLDLMATVAFYNAVCRMLASTDMDVEPSYMKYLEKYPLPQD